MRQHSRLSGASLNVDVRWLRHRSIERNASLLDFTAIGLRLIHSMNATSPHSSLRCALCSDRIVILFELGSFFAHRRRTKGDFYHFFRSAVSASMTPEGLRLGMNVAPIYSSEEILDSINRALEALDLDAVPPEAAGGLVLCIISLLQDVAFEDAKNTAALGHLFLAFNKDEIFAMAAVSVGDSEEQLVPVLRVPNRWLPWRVADEFTADGKAVLAVPNEWLTVSRTPSGLLATRYRNRTA